MGVFAFVKGKNKEEETKPSTTVITTAAPVQIVNPLTGEASFNEKAVGKRPVACVVENAYDARPQWGIDDNKNAPDIIMEGEVEGGETRMLWLYADYTSLPSQIGPMRSARPPFIKFSELFDSIFIHWGQSTSKGDYIGADAVFRNDDVDHINQMAIQASSPNSALTKRRKRSVQKLVTRLLLPSLQAQRHVTGHIILKIKCITVRITVQMLQEKICLCFTTLQNISQSTITRAAVIPKYTVTTSSQAETVNL